MRGIARLLRSEGGASAIEYGLVATLIAIAAYAAFAHLGGSVDTMLNNVSNVMPSS
jgi:pilus assembly protein Flp/PilA